MLEIKEEDPSTPKPSRHSVCRERTSEKVLDIFKIFETLFYFSFDFSVYGQTVLQNKSQNHQNYQNVSHRPPTAMECKTTETNTKHSKFPIVPNTYKASINQKKSRNTGVSFFRSIVYSTA